MVATPSRVPASPAALRRSDRLRRPSAKAADGALVQRSPGASTTVQPPSINNTTNTSPLIRLRRSANGDWHVVRPTKPSITIHLRRHRETGQWYDLKRGPRISVHLRRDKLTGQWYDPHRRNNFPSRQGTPDAGVHALSVYDLDPTGGSSPQIWKPVHDNGWSVTAPFRPPPQQPLRPLYTRRISSSLCHGCVIAVGQEVGRLFYEGEHMLRMLGNNENDEDYPVPATDGPLFAPTGSLALTQSA